MKITEVGERTSPTSVNTGHHQSLLLLRLLGLLLWGFGAFLCGSQATTPASTLLFVDHLYHLLSKVI